ncbi:MAG: C-terminal helicase domain-containing protein [Acidimicrobiales bacterium]
MPGRSGKLEATLDLLDVVRQEGERTLIFTQYVAMGNLLKTAIEEQGFSVSFLHGSQTLTERQRLVDDFQAEKNSTPSSSVCEQAARASTSPRPAMSSISTAGGTPPSKIRQATGRGELAKPSRFRSTA